MRRASEEEPDQAASDELDPFISTSSHRMNLDASGIAMKELNTTSKYVDSPVTDEPSIEHDDSRSDEPSRRPRAQSRLAEGPVTRVHRAAFIWLSGPEQPRPFSIKPIFPSFQTAPLSLIRLRQPKHWAYLYLAFCIVWFASFVSIIHISVYGCSVPGYDSVIRSSCTSQFW